MGRGSSTEVVGRRNGPFTAMGAGPPRARFAVSGKSAFGPSEMEWPADCVDGVCEFPSRPGFQIIKVDGTPGFPRSPGRPTQEVLFSRSREFADQSDRCIGFSGAIKQK